MHRPPPISVNVPRAAWQWRVTCGLWVMGVLACVAFLQQQTSTWPRVLVPLSCLVAGAAAWRGWKNALTGRLQWDGQHLYWTHFDALPVHELSVLLDFQRFLLVKIVSQQGEAAWLWLHSEQMDAQYLALRRVLIDASRRVPMQEETPAPV